MGLFPFQRLFGKFVHLPWMVGLVRVFTLYSVIHEARHNVTFSEIFSILKATSLHNVVCRHVAILLLIDQHLNLRGAWMVLRGYLRGT